MRTSISTITLGSVSFTAYPYNEANVIVEISSRGSTYVTKLGRIVMLRREWDSMVQAQATECAA